MCLFSAAILKAATVVYVAFIVSPNGQPITAVNLGLVKKPITNFARHSFATVLKRAGVGIKMISKNLGHTSVRNMEIYLGSFELEQREEVTKYLSASKRKWSKKRKIKYGLPFI